MTNDELKAINDELNALEWDPPLHGGAAVVATGGYVPTEIDHLKAQLTAAEAARDSAQLEAMGLRSALTFEQQKLAAVDAERIALQLELDRLKARYEYS